MMVYIMACIAALVLKLMERDGGNGTKLKDKLIPSARENNQWCCSGDDFCFYCRCRCRCRCGVAPDCCSRCSWCGCCLVITYVHLFPLEFREDNSMEVMMRSKRNLSVIDRIYSFYSAPFSKFVGNVVSMLNMSLTG